MVPHIDNCNFYTDSWFRFLEFFTNVDNWRSNYFLWVTSSGIKAAGQLPVRGAGGAITTHHASSLKADLDSDDEGSLDGSTEG